MSPSGGPLAPHMLDYQRCKPWQVWHVVCLITSEDGDSARVRVLRVLRTSSVQGFDRRIVPASVAVYAKVNLSGKVATWSEQKGA